MTDKPQVPAPQPDESSSHPDAAAVAVYLEAHPDFFVEHEELLATMRIPHRRGDTVSLVEHQMKILRERNIEMRHRLSDRRSVVSGKSVSVRVDLGGRRIMRKKRKN